MNAYAISQRTTDFGTVQEFYYAPMSVKLIVLLPGSCPIEDAKLSILVCKPETQFILYGKGVVYPLCGYGITVLGAELFDARPFEVVSPASHAPATLLINKINEKTRKSLEESSLSEILSSSLPGCDNVTSLVKFISDQITDENTCIFLMDKMNSRLYDSVCQMNAFRNLFNFHEEVFLPRDPFNRILGYSIEPILPGDRYGGFIDTPDMRNAADQLTIANRFMLTGPKNVGKSTFLRYVVNRILSKSQTRRLVVLDLDIGQPEFTPSGLVSLHLVTDFLLNPPVHNAIKRHQHIHLLRQAFFGGLSPTDNPSFYIECMKYVFQAYHVLPEPRPPLVVNTMGWTQNLGLSILIEQILMIQPDFIVQLELGQGNKQNLAHLTEEFLQHSKNFANESLANVAFNHSLIIIQSPAKIPMGLELDRPYNKFRKNFGAPDHRNLTLTAYMVGQLCDSRRSLPGSGPNGRPVLEHPADILVNTIPFRVNVDAKVQGNSDSFTLGLHQMHVASGTDDSINMMSSDFDPLVFNLACMNAFLVALLEMPRDQLELESKTGRILQPKQRPPVCDCLCLAFCRATEPDKGSMFITTGASPKELVSVTLACKGTMNVPNGFFLEQAQMRKRTTSSNGEFVPYTGSQMMHGPGKSTLPSKRQYPKVNQNTSHSSGDSRALDSGGLYHTKKQQ